MFFRCVSLLRPLSAVSTAPFLFFPCRPANVHAPGDLIFFSCPPTFFLNNSSVTPGSFLFREFLCVLGLTFTFTVLIPQFDISSHNCLSLVLSPAGSVFSSSCVVSVIAAGRDRTLLDGCFLDLRTSAKVLFRPPPLTSMFEDETSFFFFCFWISFLYQLSPT